MGNRWVRLVIAVILAEALPILLLIAIVAATSSGDMAADQTRAEQMGMWVGPIGGAAATLLMSWWAARRLASGYLAWGGLVGLLVAALDAGILVASAAPFQLVFAISGAGRVAAGLLGGFLARPSRPA